MKKPLFLAASFLLGLVLAGAPALAIVPSRLGPDFPVNVVTEGNQYLPDVARIAGGGFVAVWTDEHAPASVKGRIFHASGQPAGGEITLASNAFSSRVTSTPGGGFALVWTDYSFSLHLRRFDSQGNPAGAVVSFEPFGDQPDVAADGAGNLFVVWRRSGSVIYAQRFGPNGQSLGAPVALSDTAAVFHPRVAANASGGALATWIAGDLVLTRRFGPQAATWSPAVAIPSPIQLFHYWALPVLYPEGDGAVVFTEGRALRVARLDPSGAVNGAVLPAGEHAYLGHSPDVAVDSRGNAFLTWTFGGGLEEESRVYGRLFSRSWQPLGEPFAVRPDPYASDGMPAVASLASDAFAVVWANGELYWTDVQVLPIPPGPGEDGSLFGVFGQVIGPARCAAGSEVLCLGENGRFEARVTWKTPSGQTGAGHAKPLTADTGALWFVDDANLEIMVKVLDAGAVNGQFWVFYGSLSNLEYTLTVTDTRTGAVKTYQNAQRQLASRADVRAFPSQPPPPGADAALPPLEPPAAAGTALSLAQDRFRVEVEFTDPRTNTVGQGQAVPLTGDTGAFWFFDRTNLELMIKVLDGRQVNGHFWVFFGALSDVVYEITVTDTVTGQRRTYHNGRGQLASRADVNAF